MTEEHAQRIGSYALSAGLDARILTLGRGDEFAVRICQPQWHCWSFADWNAFCHERKKEQKRKRGRPRREEAYQTAIDYTVEHQVALAM